MGRYQYRHDTAELAETRRRRRNRDRAHLWTNLHLVTLGAMVGALYPVTSVAGYVGAVFVTLTIALYYARRS